MCLCSVIFRYHVPRAFLKKEKNLLVVFEETGGNPSGIKVLTVNRDTICSVVKENYPPNIDSWKLSGDKLKALVDDLKTEAELICPDGKVIKSVAFASFGDPSGACGSFAVGQCNSLNSKKVVEQVNLSLHSFLPK